MQATTIFRAKEKSINFEIKQLEQELIPKSRADVDRWEHEHDLAKDNMNLPPNEIQALRDVDWEKIMVQTDTELIYKTITEKVADPPSYYDDVVRWNDQDCQITQNWNAGLAFISLGLSVLAGHGPDYSRCERSSTERKQYPTTYTIKKRRIVIGQKPIMTEKVRK